MTKTSKQQIVVDFFALYFQPTMLAVFCLGFASGLPLALTASTLSVWLAEAGVSKAAIGLFAAIGTPYALKFLWSPLVDGMRLPLFTKLLGRRRGWLFATQLCLVAAIVALGFTDPFIDPWWTALAALMVAIASATQDIVIDAYRVEIVKPEDQGAGAAMAVLGYRFGMLASGAGALFLATGFGWTVTFMVMALLPLVGMLAALCIGEPKMVDGGWWMVDGGSKQDSSPSTIHHSPTTWLRQHVVAPFRDFMRRDQWVLVLLFILLYKLADAFMGVMTNPFLIEIGFTKVEIATVVKLYGLAATLLGGLLGGYMVARLGLMRSLWLCGIACGLTNLAFMAQARAGADVAVLTVVISLENLTSGMSAVAFVAYISRLTNVEFTATQYALLSSLAAFGRTWLSTPAGWFAETLGWEIFFVFSALLAIPGLIALAKLQKKIPAIPGAATQHKNQSIVT